MRKLIVFVATFALIVTLFGSASAGSSNDLPLSLQAASPISLTTRNKINPQVQQSIASLNSDEMMTVIVTLADQENVRNTRGGGRGARRKAIINGLRGRANASQRQIIRLLKIRQRQGTVNQYNSFWVFNGLSVTATPAVINELAGRSDVQSITTDDIEIVPVSNPLYTYNTPENNLNVINAPALLNLGFAGEGVVIASMDSGVDVSHPDLAASWRGGNNSWFDPYNQHPTTPTDLSGHGTWTMGAMVGGDNGGTLIGTAPQAQWIAVKIFNDAGSSSATAIHLGFQWLLDPDGDPNTDDAPDVVNNSWAYGYPGCNLEFQLDLQALIAADILPVFAAGNYGPYTASVSPANYPEALAVGAINDTNKIYAYSSRGPSSCGEGQSIYPELVAPGVNIRTSDRFGLYNNRATGTSLAAPHVSGALALLLSAYPDLTAEEQRLALVNTAVDLGASGADNTFGNGRLDVLAAYEWLSANGPPSDPTVTPTATETAVPPTATAIPATATATAVPSTATAIPPTVTATGVPPTATAVPPTATAIPPTATTIPATATATAVPPTATTIPPTATAVPPTATAIPPTATAVPPTATATAVTSDLIFSDGFESGDFSAWTAVFDKQNDLSVTSSAAMVGANGFAALIDNRTAMYVRDDTPSSEDRYRVRFYFDPNSINMSSGNTHRILAARNSSAEVIRLDFRYWGGDYQMRARIRKDTGSYVNTAWYILSDAPHAIEFDWQAASGVGANNGYFSLWIDNVLKQTKSNIDSDTLRIEEVRLGPLSGIDSATLGTELFDDFVSGRTNYIGP